MDHKSHYRPDIDGLRAIAVLSVFAFHLGLYRIARGGFIGVDIFFVISGYLITRIISRQIRENSFNIAHFYRRRVLRIIPALIVMMIGALAGSLLLLPPVELVEFGRSAIATSLSVSNIFFYNSPSGYFFDELNARPLLHTWSLGVEEQFYIIFPLMLVMTHRWFADRLRLTILFVGLLSLAISLWSLRHNPNGAFFLLPSRFWELMLGAAGALGIIGVPRSRWAREAQAGIGAVAIVFSIAFINGGYMPYYWAVVPCAGAIIVILTAESGHTFVSRALSWPPLVWVGLISYSLYLWHWPVIVFYHIGLLQPWTLIGRGAVLATSIALASASFYFVEQPFRRIPKTISNFQILAPTGAVLAASATAGIVLISLAGLPSRFNPQADYVSAALDPRGPDRFRSGKCFISRPNEAFDWNRCLGPQTGKRLILFGDSHAAVFADALASRPDFRQVTTTYCRPLLGMDRAGLPFCAQIVERFFADYLKGNHPNDTVIISERWADNQLIALQKTLEAFRKTGARVVLIGPVPEYLIALPRLEFASMATGHDFVSSNLDPSFAVTDRELTSIAKFEKIPYVSVVRWLCAGSHCKAMIDQHTPVMSDTDHLSAEAARQLSKMILSATAWK